MCNRIPLPWVLVGQKQMEHVVLYLLRQGTYHGSEWPLWAPSCKLILIICVHHDRFTPVWSCMQQAPWSGILRWHTSLWPELKNVPAFPISVKMCLWTDLEPVISFMNQTNKEVTVSHHHHWTPPNLGKTRITWLMQSRLSIQWIHCLAQPRMCWCVLMCPKLSGSRKRRNVEALCVYH